MSRRDLTTADGSIIDPRGDMEVLVEALPGVESDTGYVDPALSGVARRIDRRLDEIEQQIKLFREKLTQLVPLQSDMDVARRLINELGRRYDAVRTVLEELAEPED